MVLHTKNTGVDESKLGRLTWKRYRDEENLIMRIITIYLPNKPTEQGDRKIYYQ